jgi:hypothetical protein
MKFILSKALRNIVVILPALAACVTFTAFFQTPPLHYRLASDPSLNGKGKEGKCMDYALALSSRLAAKGIHGRLVFFKWRLRDSNLSDNHVFVMYHPTENSEWIVDNKTTHPRQVPVGASLMQLVFLLSDDPSAPVDVELQDGLNHTAFF